MIKFEDYLEAVKKSVGTKIEGINEAKIPDSANFYAPSRSGALDDLLMQTENADEDEKRMIAAVKKFKRVTPEFLMSIKEKIKKSVLKKMKEEGRNVKQMESFKSKIDAGNQKLLMKLIDDEVSDMADGTNVFGMGYDFINYIGIKVAFENIDKKSPI